MPTPELWLIGGPNGAGKTTLAQASPIQSLLPHVALLNPDDRALAKLGRQGIASFRSASPEVLRTAFAAAAGDVFAELVERLGRSEAVCVETVLSTDKYKPLVESLQQTGFVGLIYVALRSPELACERVARRVHLGGHDVPKERIIRRWHRSIHNLTWFAAKAHRFWVFDNSDSDANRPPALLADGRRGRAVIHDTDAIPEVTAALSELRET